MKYYRDVVPPPLPAPKMEKKKKQSRGKTVSRVNKNVRLE